jgi:hypothetical protein
MTDFRCSSSNPKEAQLVLRRYHLPSIRGQGGWAVIILGSDGMFSAISDYGHYGHYWGAHGCGDFREFFLQVEREWDYFVAKLAGGAVEYDGEATVAEVKKYILEVRRDTSWSKKRARREWDLVKKHDELDSDYNFARWLEDTEIDEAYEYHQTRPSVDAVSFVKKTLVRLVPILQAELDAEKILLGVPTEDLREPLVDVTGCDV